MVVADDDAGIRDALTELIGEHPAFRVVAAVEDGATAARVCEELSPDLVIVDVSMPDGGEAAVTAILEVAPSTRVVIYTACSDRRVHARLLAAGSEAVFVKGKEAALADALAALVSIG